MIAILAGHLPAKRFSHEEWLAVSVCERALYNARPDSPLASYAFRPIVRVKMGRKVVNDSDDQEAFRAWRRGLLADWARAAS